MLRLLGGLLFRPTAVMESFVREPRREQASQLAFFLIVLSMINLAFFTVADPMLETYLGEWGQWVFVLLFPPLQFYFQRFLYVIAVRLGIGMFAAKSLPQDPEERRKQVEIVKLIFPYTLYPSIFLGVVAGIFPSPLLVVWFTFVGYLYLFVISTVALRALYNVSTAVALFGPFLVQLLILFFLTIVLTIVFLIIFLATGMTIPGMPTV